jgi:hypothetical protein
MATVRVMKIDISATSVIKNKLVKCATQPKINRNVKASIISIIETKQKYS